MLLTLYQKFSPLGVLQVFEVLIFAHFIYKQAICFVCCEIFETIALLIVLTFPIVVIVYIFLSIIITNIIAIIKSQSKNLSKFLNLNLCHIYYKNFIYEDVNKDGKRYIFCFWKVSFSSFNIQQLFLLTYIWLSIQSMHFQRYTYFLKESLSKKYTYICIVRQAQANGFYITIVKDLFSFRALVSMDHIYSVGITERDHVIS